MKKIAVIIISFVLAFSLTVTAFAFQSLVDDSAGLFSEWELEEITQQSADFSAETGLSLAVVTTDDTNGRITEDFAEDYYDDLMNHRDWPQDGLMLIIDMDNREVFTSAVGNTWGDFSDSEISYITDCGFNEVSRGEYAGAISSMIDAASDSFGDDEGYYNDYDHDYDYNYDYDFDFNEEHYYEEDYSGGASFDVTDILFYVIIGLVAGGIAVIVVKSRYKNNGKGDEFDTDDVILDLTASNDTVISRNVVTSKIPKNNNKGGSGGVSVHRSSCGSVHRSSGRKF